MKIKQIRVDGYKNLINCELNLGDFNVLVGPNNSGKSNLLEVLKILFFFCFGDENTRKIVFSGFPISLSGTSISHIKEYEKRDLSIGFTFETIIGNNSWIVDYDFRAHREIQQNEKAKFVQEILQAKPIQRKGPRTIYISRDAEQLEIETVLGKKIHNIANNISAFVAIKTLYPDFTNLPNEMKQFIEILTEIALTYIFLFSPDNIRKSINEREDYNLGSSLRVTSLDVISTINDINKDAGRFDLFKNTVCDILDLEDLKFISQEIQKPSSNENEKDIDKAGTEMILRLYLKKYGSEYAPIGEFSDGTLVILAILSAYLSHKIFSPILCVEELENCLHPSALKKLLKFLQDWSNKKQVLITTHSPYVLNCVNPEDVNLAIVDETGATHFKKVENTKQLRDYLKTGFMSFGDMLASNFEDVLRK